MPTEAARPDQAAPAPRRTAEAGFTIVELMIGTVLIVVGLVGIMSSCIRLHRLQQLDTEIGHALRACRTNLEELRSVPIATLAGFDGRGFDVVGPDGVAVGLPAAPDDSDGLPGEIHVTLDQAAAGRSLYRIRTVVNWQGASGRHSVDLATLRGGMP